MRRILAIALGSVSMWLAQPATAAFAQAITYSHKHHLFTVYPASQREWRTGDTQWTYRGVPAQPTFCDADCADVLVPEGWQRAPAEGWNRGAIAATITSVVAAELDRVAGHVIITRDGTGSVAFSGAGLTGRSVDVPWAVDLTIRALEEGIGNVVLPVTETQPTIDVRDSALRAMGIREVVTVGESNFTGSPANRQHNIKVGLSKFSGVLIPQGATFSFNEALGPVNAATGYLRELVIQGDRTVPDYGGGLCQVSSTAYRGIWEYGFPIVQRKNHSYTVSYYSPQGTDATIYPPNVDLKFMNDSPGALLLQTFVDDDFHAYFVYYGTRDARQSEVFGPFTWGTTPAPPDKKIEYTTEIPPGTEKKLGSKVPGMRTSWFRSVTMPEADPVITETYSAYEARPLFYQVGVTPEEMARLTAPALIELPSWLPVID